jgi:hypothetical protein
MTHDKTASLADFIREKFNMAKIDKAEEFVKSIVGASPSKPFLPIQPTQPNPAAWSLPKPRSFTMPLDEFRALEVSSAGQLIDVLMVKGRFLDIDVSDRVSIEMGNDSVEVKFKGKNTFGMSGMMTATEMSMKQTDADYRMQQAIHQMSLQTSQNIEKQVLELIQSGVPIDKIAVQRYDDTMTCQPVVKVKVVR